jgi:hypothetical protein
VAENLLKHQADAPRREQGFERALVKEADDAAFEREADEGGGEERGDERDGKYQLKPAPVNPSPLMLTLPKKVNIRPLPKMPCTM